MEALAKMWRGEVSLVKTFWLWGIATIVGLSVGMQFVFLQMALAGLGRLLQLGIVIAAAGVAYQFVVSVGVWRSAGRYTGSRLWAISARAVSVISFASIALAVVLFASFYFQDTHDGSRTSANVAATLSRSPDYPLTGFWKSDCSEGFGLAIEPTTEPSMYSVSFCGPGGCFRPGTYRPNTRIVGDPLYRVIDENAIEVQGQDGFSRYVRCQ